MKRIRQIVVTAMVFCSLVACGAQTAMACTSVYVGSEASADGTTIISRSSDTPEVWGNHITLTERVDGESGRQMPVDSKSTVFAELPETTYKYVAAPFMESTMVANDLANDAGACTNEYGVAITLSVTAFSNEDALKADPLIETGLTENTAADLVICQSKSAREAVDVLLSLIDEYGSSECNVALIADQEEAWYVEMYTGHQYAAVKLPADKVCAFGNEFTLEYLSDYEDFIVSENLENLAKENQFAAYGENDELNLLDTYSGESVAINYSHMRTWIGHQLLAPSKFSDDYALEARYPLCFEADEPVSLSDVCAVLRNRYEGTQYCPDETGRIDMRVIGTDTALNVHVLQIYPNLPTEMSCVMWESTGPAIYGVFVPISNAATSISKAYENDQPAKDAGMFDAEHYPYYAFKELTTLCVEQDTCEVYGAPVRDYWHSAEQGMFAGMPKVLTRASEMKDKTAAADYITNYCNDMQEQAFLDAKYLVNDVVMTQSQNSNTLKMQRDPQTHEILDTQRVLDPMEITLDATIYEKVPDTP